MEYLPRNDFSKVLQTLRTRLSQNGALVLFITKRNWVTRPLIGRWWQSNLYNADELRAAFGDAGFTMATFSRFPFPYGHLNLWGYIVEACKGLWPLRTESVSNRSPCRICVVAFSAFISVAGAFGDEQGTQKLIQKPGLFTSLTEPPCSYCSTQDRKGLIRHDDRVIAWVRGAHNGGAIPLRHFLAAPRVINDTYGLFFYDPDGGYVSAFEKDYGYEFDGWRSGVMVVKGRDGTLWSALSGEAFAGPQKGHKLNRLPSTMTTWAYWRMLHPESTAYDLFDGKKYAIADLPTELTSEAKESMGKVDSRLEPLTRVLGVEIENKFKALPLDENVERACFIDSLSGVRFAAFWYGPTQSAIAYSAQVDGQSLTFYADDISPETAPFKDKETGSRWTIAGRAVDGPLRGKELTWVNSIECRWYAWVAEHPKTEVYVESR